MTKQDDDIRAAHKILSDAKVPAENRQVMADDDPRVFNPLATKQTDWLENLAKLNELGRPDLEGACEICGINPRAVQAHIAEEAAEAYKRGYIAGGIEQVNANADEVIKARIDELRSLYPKLEQGYSGGAFVVRASKIDERLAELKAKLKGVK